MGRPLPLTDCRSVPECGSALPRSGTTVLPVPAPLSPEWFAAADELLRADADLRDRSRGVHLVLQQTVVDGTDEITWHIVLDDGSVSLQVGPAAAPHVAFRCDRATADAVRAGTESAQSAFIQGRLRIDGSPGALLEHAELLGGLTDVLAPLR